MKRYRYEAPVDDVVVDKVHHVTVDSHQAMTLDTLYATRDRRLSLSLGELIGTRKVHDKR
jgi:hypothetical protein